jgi:predicted nuclease of predicted toxin-antitoxin system
MTFWLDAHLPPDLATWLGSKFKIVVKPLREIGLREATDPVIRQAARRFAPVTMITKDVEFAERAQEEGSPQVILIRCGNLSKIEYQALLSRHFEAALGVLQTGVVCAQIRAEEPDA